MAFVDRGDVAIIPEPGYLAYLGGTLLSEGQAYAYPLRPRTEFLVDLDEIPEAVLGRAKVLYLNYPNNPTGAVAPEGLFERAVAFAREHDVLIVHDASYTETTFEGYVAPSFLETPGAKEVGVEVFSLSKGWNMTGWRTAAVVGNADAVRTYWKLKTNIDSGAFEAVQLAAAKALADGPPAGMAALYERRRDLVCSALREIGVEVTPPKGTIYVWAPVPGGHTSASYCELVLEESGVVISPGSAYGPNGEGFFRISLTIADERLTEAVERLRGSLGG
jgi:LL-diaminopimelate aminotransferase